MKKIARFLLAAALTIYLAACQNNPSGGSGTDESILCPDVGVSGLGYQYYESMEEFTAAMDRAFFIKAGAEYPPSELERFHMLLVERCYYLPTVEDEDVEPNSVSIDGHLMSFGYKIGDKNEYLRINIPTHLARKMDENEKSLLAMAEETTRGRAPYTTWSYYAAKGEEVAISSDNDLVFMVGDYLATMYVSEWNESTESYEHASSVINYYEKTTFERISLN